MLDYENDYENFFNKKIKTGTEQGYGIKTGINTKSNLHRKKPKAKTNMIRSKGRIIERDRFSGHVRVIVGSRFFNSSTEVLWVRFRRKNFPLK